MRRQHRANAYYDVNRSYARNSEDFGSNSRVHDGWDEQDRSRSFYGKGPRGYKRSDERIQEDVHEVLTWNWEVDASDIEVAVHEGEVTLSGFVSDRKMKRLAEELIEDISGVRDVSNHLKISRESAPESLAMAPSRKTRSSIARKAQGAKRKRH